MRFFKNFVVGMLVFSVGMLFLWGLGSLVTDWFGIDMSKMVKDNEHFGKELLKWLIGILSSLVIMLTVVFFTWLGETVTGDSKSSEYDDPM